MSKTAGAFAHHGNRTKDRKRRGTTYERILEVATECFAKDGFDGASMRDIAERVGIREPSIYRHFESKEDLYVQVLYQGLTPIANALLELTRKRLNMRELADVPGQMLRLHAENPHLASLVQQAVNMPSDRFERDLLTEWLDRMLETGKRALMESNFVSSDELEISLWILNLFNLCIGYFTNGKLLERLCNAQPGDPETLRRQERVLGIASRAWIIAE